MSGGRFRSSGVRYKSAPRLVRGTFAQNSPHDGGCPHPRRGRAAALVAVVAVVVLVTVGAVPSSGSHAGPHAALGLASSAVPRASTGLSALGGIRPSLPGGSVGSLNLTIYNPGPNATGTYEQPVAINSSRYASLINSNWSNGVAYYAANATPVYAWIESGASNASVDTLLWLRLGSIAPLGRVNVSIAFWPPSSFNLSESGYVGENAALSPVYGEWDNGWRVFDAYANFSGTALPSGWTVLGGWAGTVHHGLTVGAVYGEGAIEATLGAFAASSVTVETSARMNGTASPLSLFMATAPGFNGQYQSFPGAFSLNPGTNGTATAVLRTSNATGAVWSTVGPLTAPTDFTQAPHVVGLSWRVSNSTETGSVNGIPFISQVLGNNGPMTEYGVGAYCARNCSTWNVTWVRAREAPSPMPLVSNDGFSPVGVAVATTPLSTDVGHSVAFSCTAVGTARPFNATWTFGDGGVGGGAVASHAYALPGTYVATCTAVGTLDATGESTAAVSIRADPAILLFQALPSSFALGQTLNLVANISGGTGPFVYTYVGLPPGCPPRNTPTFSCLPGVTGTFAIEVIVEDAVKESTAAWITITVTTPVSPPSSPTISPVEGYAIAGGVAGLVVLAGVIPVMLWNRRIVPSPRPPARREPPARPPEPQSDAGDAADSEFEARG